MALTCDIAAKLSGVVARRIQKLAKLGRIPGATKHGKSWLIPDNFQITPSKGKPGRKLAKLKDRSTVK